MWYRFWQIGISFCFLIFFLYLTALRLVLRLDSVFFSVFSFPGCPEKDGLGVFGSFGFVGCVI
jgi:hypothetical protein